MYLSEEKHLFINQNDYYRILDVDPKCRRAKVSERFLVSRGLPLAEHKV